MARLKLPIRTAANPEEMSKIMDRSGKKIIGNTIVDRLKNPKSSKIMTVSEKMINNGILEPTAVRSPDLLSEKILGAMGCSIISDGLLANREYSLIEDQDDTETIDNPSKVDFEQFKKIKKQKITIDSVFKNQNDSIFNLDTALPNNYLQLEQKNIDVVKKVPKVSLSKIVVKAIDLSLNTAGVKAVRAFKEI